MAPAGHRDLQLRQDEHYLKRELYELVRTDPSIFEFLQNGTLDGLWYWDITDPSQEWMNPRFKELFGFEDHEVPNESSWWMEQIHPDDLPIALENYEKHRDDPNHPYDQVVRYAHKDGSTVWVRCRGLAVRDENGEAIRLLGCHTDVTAEKVVEAALERRNGELLHALRTAQLANDELERFAGSVAHDLRSPLAIVTSFAQLLRERLHDDPELERFAETIVRNADRSLTMISDLLAFAMTVGQEGELEVVDLAEVLSWVTETLEDAIVTTGASIVVEELPVVHAWPAALRQIFLNLIENAIKYRHPERPLRLRVHGGTEHRRAVSIIVEDNGIGIPSDQREKIFQLGARAGGEASAEVEGSGVGLATCQALVLRLGGTIHAAAGPEGVGTIMTVSLPVAGSASNRVEPKRTVMVVDDDPDAIALADVVLSETGVGVVATASSAPEAIETYLRLDPPPHLLIIDLDLGPGGSGLDVIRNIRQIEPDQLMVLRSAHLDDVSATHAEALGIAACVTKRSVDDLRDIVERFCG